MTAVHVTPGEGSPIPDRSGAAARFIDACLYCAKPARLRRTVTIALVVGTILTLLNQGDVILGGNATGATAVKAALNYMVPFVVSNLGLLSGRDIPSGGGDG
jgi:hypothetical protein